MTKRSTAQFYVLDLNGCILESNPLHSWRLRSAPHMNASEIGCFYHGDRILAARDADQPCWLKLAGKPGWVHELHEGRAVWKAALSDSDTESHANILEEFPSTSKCYDGKDTSTKNSTTGSNGSQESLVARGPSPFTGIGHTLGEEYASWFTGTSYRLTPTQVPCSRQEVRPRWADLVDSDDDEIISIEPSSFPAKKDANVDRVDAFQLDSKLESAPVSKLVDLLPSSVKVANEIELSADNLEQLLAENKSEKSSVSEPVRNPRRKRRNEHLLQRKNKTLFCRYLEVEGACPFGDSCWFAHCTTEMRRSNVDVRECNERGPAEEGTQDEKLKATNDIVSNPRKLSRSKAVLNRNHKTQLCQYSSGGGCCPFGDKCWFAHGGEELQIIADV